LEFSWFPRRIVKCKLAVMIFLLEFDGWITIVRVFNRWRWKIIIIFQKFSTSSIEAPLITFIFFSHSNYHLLLSGRKLENRFVNILPEFIGNENIYCFRFWFYWILSPIKESSKRLFFNKLWMGFPRNSICIYIVYEWKILKAHQLNHKLKTLKSQHAIHRTFLHLKFWSLYCVYLWLYWWIFL
jgi:hypothetical protein